MIKIDLSLAVPISNSLTFAFTTIAGKFVGEPFGGASKKIIFKIIKTMQYMTYDNIIIYV